MIALDTNILVRYLVCDDLEQAEVAGEVLESLSDDSPGYVCREVTVELVWVLERSYGFSRDQIATTVEELIGTQGLVFEEADDVAIAAYRFPSASVGFSDLMILAAAERSAAQPVYTFDRKAARIEGMSLV